MIIIIIRSLHTPYGHNRLQLVFSALPAFTLRSFLLFLLFIFHIRPSSLAEMAAVASGSAVASGAASSGGSGGGMSLGAAGSITGGVLKEVANKWTLIMQTIVNMSQLSEELEGGLKSGKWALSIYHSDWWWKEAITNEKMLIERFGPLGKRLLNNPEIMQAAMDASAAGGNTEAARKLLFDKAGAVVESTKQGALRDAMASNALFALGAVVELGMDVRATWIILEKSKKLRRSMPYTLDTIQQHIDKGLAKSERVKRIFQAKAKFRLDLYTVAVGEFDAALIAIDGLLTSLNESEADLTTQRNIHAAKSAAAFANVVLSSAQFFMNPLLGSARIFAQLAVGGFSVATLGHGLTAMFTHEEILELRKCIDTVQEKYQLVTKYIAALEDVKGKSEQNDEDNDID